MKGYALLLLTGLLLLPGNAAAETSNLSNGNYPEMHCRSPLRPLQGDGPRDWRLYRSEMQTYRECVETYLADAKRDMDQIRTQMDKAIRQYNEESGNRQGR